jgi:hypothetical protein
MTGPRLFPIFKKIFAGKFGIFTLLSKFALLIKWEYRNEKRNRNWRSGN